MFVVSAFRHHEPHSHLPNRRSLRFAALGVHCVLMGKGIPLSRSLSARVLAGGCFTSTARGLVVQAQSSAYSSGIRGGEGGGGKEGVTADS